MWWGGAPYPHRWEALISPLQEDQGGVWEIGVVHLLAELQPSNHPIPKKQCLCLDVVAA